MRRMILGAGISPLMAWPSFSEDAGPSYPRPAIARGDAFGSSEHSFLNTATGITGTGADSNPIPDHGGILATDADMWDGATIYSTFLPGSSEASRYAINGDERTATYDGPLIVALFGNAGTGQMWNPGETEWTEQRDTLVAYATEALAAGRAYMAIATPWPPSPTSTDPYFEDISRKTQLLRDEIEAAVPGIQVWVFPEHLMVQYALATYGGDVYGGDGLHLRRPDELPLHYTTWAMSRMLDMFLTQEQWDTTGDPAELADLTDEAWRILTTYEWCGMGGGTVVVPTFNPANAQIYVDDGSAPAGTMTSLTTEGTVPLTFSMVGSGSDPTMGADGISFPGGGRYFRWTGAAGVPYDGALFMAEVTRTGPPSGGAHQFLSLDIDATERAVFRSTGTIFQVNGPGNLTANGAQLTPYGDRQITVMEVDYRNGVIRILSSDGWIEEVLTPTATPLNLNRIDIGNGVVGTIHRMACFLRPVSGDYAVDGMHDLWAQVGGTAYPRFQDTARIWWEFEGQSLQYGPDTTTGDRATLPLVNRPGNLAPFGFLRSDAATVGYQGPGLIGLDETHPASGVGPATLVAACPPAFSAGTALDRIRRDLDVSTPPATISFGAPISGQEWERFDNDPNTFPTGGSAPDNTFSWDNSSYMLDEVQRIETAAGRSCAAMIFDWSQGTADRRKTQAQYLAGVGAIWTQKKALYAGKGIAASRLMLMMQSGGMADTTPVIDTWDCVLAQVEFARNNGDVLLVGPEWQWIVGPEADTNPSVHPELPESRLSGELRAWALAEHLAGNQWEILPQTPTFIGNQVILPFSLRDDETLALETGKYDSYGGVADTGIEISGATITDVSMSGDSRSIVVTADGPISMVQGAMQVADNSLDKDGSNRGYTAHRMEWRTTLERDSVLIGGRKLQRFLPSFRWSA